MNKKPESNQNSTGTGAGVGIVFGVALGAAFDNVGLGIALGLVFGAALEQQYPDLFKDKNKDS